MTRRSTGFDYSSDTQPAAVTDVGANQVAEVTDGQGDAAETLLGQLAQHDVQMEHLSPIGTSGLGNRVV